MFPLKVLTALLLSVLVLLSATSTVEATYRKPPGLNGSIFGKRGNVVGEYDSGGKALGAMCEIALEACGSWFPQDNK